MFSGQPIWWSIRNITVGVVDAIRCVSVGDKLSKKLVYSLRHKMAFFAYCPYEEAFSLAKCLIRLIEISSQSMRPTYAEVQ